MEYIVPITNGIGSKELIDGNYSVTSNVSGYDNNTLSPNKISVSDDVSTYEFTVAATGKLTLHVSDNGTIYGVPIISASFYRCDASGKVYGEKLTTDMSGMVVFNNVPYAATNAPFVYFKQVEGDLEHTFNKEVQKVALVKEETTLEIENAPAPERTFKLTDANYAGLPIEDGEIILKEVV